MVCVALALALGPGTQGPLLADPFPVESPVRLAVTPRMDGRLEEGEWQRLSRDEELASYLQWEPGILYLAGTTRLDRDLVFSLDLLADGWLVGSDNLELRVSWTGNEPTVRARFLDNTGRQGPEWREAPTIVDLTRVVAAADPTSWTAEIKFLALPFAEIRAGRPLGVRVDAFPTLGTEVQAFLPRPTGVVTFALERGTGLPEGLSWRPETKARSVVPGDTLRIRFNVTWPGGSIDTAELRTVGLGREATATLRQPFPAFDRRGRAFVDYETPIAEGAEVGYRIVQATLDGGSLRGPVVLETSFAIADLVTFEVRLPRRIAARDESQVVRGSIRVLSQSRNRLDGTFTLVAPRDWTVARGSGDRFTIYQARGAARIPVELILPAGTRGTFPLTAKAAIGDRVVESTFFLPVE